MNRTPVETTASGRFRICPVCKRHVPPGVVECRCGVDLPEVASARPAGSGRSIPVAPVLWTTAVVVAFFVGREVGRSAVPAPSKEKAFIPYPMQVTAAATPEPEATPWIFDAGLPATPLPATTIPTPAPAAPRFEAALAPATPRPWDGLEPSPSPDATRTQAHWQGLLGETRGKIQTAYTACLAEWKKASEVARQDVGMAWTETPTGTVADVAGARAALLAALTAQVQLEESARRAGVPPGWVRIDWSAYPPLSAPPGAGGSGHPCSVPELLRTTGY